jgi:hypothetical protein
LDLIMSFDFVAAFDRSDWRHRRTRDAVAIFGLGTLVFALAHIYELPPHLLQFGLDHADWEADDLIFVMFMLSAAMTIYGFRRYRDLSEEMKAREIAEREALMLARHDPLTGLPNRRYFEQRLSQCLRNAGAEKQLAVRLLDLDGFKAVNDNHGHAVGDDSLRAFADGLSALALRHDDCKARRRRIRHHCSFS